MFFFKILRTYKRATLSNLLQFVLTLVTNMAKPRYDAVRDQVTLVSTALAEAQAAKTAAANKGKTEVQTRDIKIAALLVQVSVLADMMEAIHTEDITFYTEAGFELRKEPTKNEGELPVPEWKFVKNNIKEGSVKGQVKNFPKSANLLEVRCSNDGGLTWPYVFFSTGQTVTITGLEKRKDYLFSACFHGTRQRVSDWGANYELFVV